ncbi:GNAT family N-acetyltransferase [Arthrobacter sp. 35W]|uniref:GNAT family N-acetyltransferase n=1 Tax=Arthrobacter sp. 35W TaxID=1132441 RepID=UPI00040FA2F2|nr:GNAT family N-acetyltransferase [Arthrobacter sp. 35W]
MGATIRQATVQDAAALAELAAITFPLACPPSSAPEDIAAFIDANLTEEHFGGYLADPQRTVLVADDDGSLGGYALLVSAPPADPQVAKVLEAAAQPVIELSKCYVHPDHHGAGLAAALMAASVAHGARLGAASLWLGVNDENARAIRFYQKSGFVQMGTKTFMLGTRQEHDYVMVRPTD